ncbi:MAG TPA: tetratricopeptide repeat protein [Methylomirabilota bacterium]|nr:tetratricopeptide repeat protein [Methylomirabilota bacterium]
MAGARTTRRDALLVALLTLAVFAPVLANGWVEWDDLFNFGENPNYRGLGWIHVRWMFTDAWGGHWTPLPWLTLALDYVLWGMNPRGYHLASMLWHAANAALVFLVAARLLRRAWPGAGEGALRLGAAAAALVFALHPLRVESVAWITERRDLVSGFFYLATVLAWLIMQERAGDERRRWYLAALAAYAGALLSKSIVISLPFVLLVLDVYPLRRLTASSWRAEPGRRVALEKIPFVAMAVLVTVFTAVSFRSRLAPLDAYPPTARLGMVGYSLAFYVGKTLVPADLSPLYELPWRVSLADTPFLVATLIVLLAAAALVVARRWWPAGLAAAVAYALTLAPVSGIAQAGPQLVADRYSYLATLGLALLLGSAIVALVTSALRPSIVRLALGAVGAWLVVLALLSVSQQARWHDDRALWEHALAVDGDCGRCAKAYARYQTVSGEAEARFRRMLADSPADLDARIRLAVVLFQARRFDDAEQELRVALRTAPNSPEALTFLGLTLFERGRAADAVPILKTASELAPTAALPHFGLGRSLQVLNRDAEVWPHLAALERLEPRLAERLKRRW